MNLFIKLHINIKQTASVLKNNKIELNKHFKNSYISGLVLANDVIRWESSKYFIVSTIQDNDFNESVNIYRKSDGKKIFSAIWGFDFDSKQFSKT
jgi:hypothetical protein